MLQRVQRHQGVRSQRRGRRVAGAQQILELLEQRVQERTFIVVFEVPAQVQLRKLKDGRAIDTAATVPRPFCCPSFQKRGVPR